MCYGFQDDLPGSNGQHHLVLVGLGKLDDVRSANAMKRHFLAGPKINLNSRDEAKAVVWALRTEGCGGRGRHIIGRVLLVHTSTNTETTAEVC